MREILKLRKENSTSISGIISRVWRIILLNTRIKQKAKSSIRGNKATSIQSTWSNLTKSQHTIQGLSKTHQGIRTIITIILKWISEESLIKASLNQNWMKEFFISKAWSSHNQNFKDSLARINSIRES